MGATMVVKMVTTTVMPTMVVESGVLKGAPLTLTKVSLFLTSRPVVLPTHGWVRAQSADFNMCNDGGYVSNMAGSYDSMVFTASLWGGGGIDMNWLDGMTGCGGERNIDGS